MKFAVMSDLHLEFGPHTEELPDADVLLLVGDILVASPLQKHRTDASATKMKDRAGDFFSRVYQKYEKTYYVLGNHEHYHGDFKTSKGIIQNFLEDNLFTPRSITILDQTIGYPRDGYVVLGVPLWTDFLNGSKDSIMAAQFGLNDYRLVSNGEADLHPSDTMAVHKENVKWLDANIFQISSKNPDTKIIVMGHHAPSKKSIHKDYVRDKELNGAYFTDLEWLMSEKIQLWVHGHTHNSFDYNVNGTRVVCNPFGYKNNDQNKSFVPKLVIEV